MAILFYLSVDVGYHEIWNNQEIEMYGVISEHFNVHVRKYGSLGGT